MVAEVQTKEIIIANVSDALDVMGELYQPDVKKIILYEENFLPEFFDLSTKLAGEILQKFAQYGIQAAIIGDYSKFKSKSLKDFIYECNKSGKILFVSSREEALRLMLA